MFDYRLHELHTNPWTHIPTIGHSVKFIVFSQPRKSKPFKKNF
jgi:hypothetical protein